MVVTVSSGDGGATWLVDECLRQFAYKERGKKFRVTTISSAAAAAAAAALGFVSISRTAHCKFVLKKFIKMFQKEKKEQ